MITMKKNGTRAEREMSCVTSIAVCESLHLILNMESQKWCCFSSKQTHITLTYRLRLIEQLLGEIMSCLVPE